MRNKSIFTALGIILLLLLGIFAAEAAEKDYTPDVKMHTLPNGLILMVVEKHDSPTVCCYRYHKVGSINEWPGMTGAAHLLEHMMFKGTERIGTVDYKAEIPIMKEIDRLLDEIDKERAKGLTDYQKADKEKIERLWTQVKELQNKQRQYIKKNEIWTIYDSHGGNEMNASTSFDATDYYLNLPSNKMEVWAFLESDRIQNPVFREFYSERDVVNEERRMYAARPQGAMFDALMNNFFITMPYGHNIVGWESDLESLRREKVLDFLKTFYAPNNTILVLVGDVDDAKALAMVEKYFGGIPRQPEPPVLFSSEPAQKGERRVEVEFDAEPEFYIAFHGPKPGNPDQYAMEAISYILSSGNSSRLYKSIVETNIGASCEGFQWEMGYVNPFVIEGVPKPPYICVQMEKAIYKQLELLKTVPVSKKELEKVHNMVDMDYINHLKNPMSLAIHLARAQAWTGDWRNLDYRSKIKRVTPQDIQRVAKKYFTKSNRTVITLVPTKPTNISVKGKK